MNFSYTDVKYWSDLLGYACSFDRDGRIYLSDTFTVKEFDDLEEATKFLIPMFVQEQAM